VSSTAPSRSTRPTTRASRTSSGSPTARGGCCTSRAPGFFIAEGEKVIARTAAAGYPPRSLLVSPSRLADLSPEVAALDCPVYVASYDVLEAVTGFHVHRGALASFGRLPLRSAADVLATARRVVVMERSPTTPTSARSSAARRARHGRRPAQPRLVRPALPAVRARVDGPGLLGALRLPRALAGGIDDVREAGFRVLALTPAAGATDLSEVTVAADEKVALLLGAEGPGLTEEVMAASDERVRIPMSAGVDSLNVGAAAAVACWVLGRRS
jgi:tRNA G18 (ribose-2'-O)-methylase SpoU